MTYIPPVRHYGLLLAQNKSGSFVHITATMIVREDENSSPVNPKSDGESTWSNDNIPKHLAGLQLADLGMHGFISDNGEHEYICYEPAYSAPYKVDCASVERMRAAFKRLNKQLAKDNPTEPGDVFMSLAAAFKLEFAVWKIEGHGGGNWGYSSHNWRWSTLPEGRDQFRRMILTARNEARGIKSGAA